MAPFIFAIVLVGFSSVLTQTLLIRELTTVFYGNELTIGVMLSAWLGWGALGSFGLGRLADKLKKGITPFVITQILVALLLPLQFLLVKSVRSIIGASPGELMGPIPVLLSSYLILAPFCILSGFQFTLGARVYAEKKRTGEAIGRVYGLDALGDMLGGGLFAWVFVYIFTSLQSLYIVSLLNLCSAISLLLFYERRKILLGLSAFLFFAYILSGLSPLLKSIEEKATGWEWRGFDLIETRSSLYGNLAVTKYEDLYSLYENGVLSFTTPVRIVPEELVHIPMLQTKNPKRMLILGDAVSGGLREILKYPVEEVFYLELDPAILELAERYIPEEDKNALRDKKVKILHMDGRLFIKRYKGKRFDVIILNLPDPYTAFINRFYTLEFFEELKRIIKQDGVISLSISSKENYLTQELLDFNGSIYHTLKKIFPHIVLLPGDKLTLIASLSREYLTEDPELLGNRLEERRIETEYMSRYYFEGKLMPWTIKYIRGLLEGYTPEINKDFYPITYLYGIGHWSTYFQPFLRKLFGFLSKLKLLWLCLGLGILWISPLFYKKRLSLPLSTFSLGLGGMVGVVVSILSFQILYGYVYHRIGIVTASFMLGVVLGAQWMTSRLGKRGFLAFYSLQLLTGAYLSSLPLLFIFLSKLDFKIVELLFPFLTLFLGLLIGAAFPLANSLYSRIDTRPGRVAGIFYASDLLGGALGALISSLAIIPIYGIFTTCWLVGGLNGLAMVTLLIAVKRRAYV